MTTWLDRRETSKYGNHENDRRHLHSMVLVLRLTLKRCYVWFCFFFFKQKTAYEMRISDWISDVCSSDLRDSDEEYPDRIRRHRRPCDGELAPADRGGRRGDGQYQPRPRRRGGFPRCRDAEPASDDGRRDHARPRPYAGRREPARQGLPRTLLRRVRPLPALSDGRDRRPAEGCRLGGADFGDRKSVVLGKRMSVRVGIGGRLHIIKKTT